MIKCYKRTSNSLIKEKVNLINKIIKMENVIWDDILNDTKNGLDVIDIDVLIDRFENTKDLYDRHMKIKILDQLTKDF